MKLAELKAMIRTAEELGHGEVELFYENGRDGKRDLKPVTAEFRRMGDQREPSTILVFKQGK